MNQAWAQVKAATAAAGPSLNRRALRDRLRSEPELAVARKGVFGAWKRKRSHASQRSGEGRGVPVAAGSTLDTSDPSPSEERSSSEKNSPNLAASAAQEE